MAIQNAEKTPHKMVGQTLVFGQKTTSFLQRFFALQLSKTLPKYLFGYSLSRLFVDSQVSFFIEVGVQKCIETRIFYFGFIGVSIGEKEDLIF